MASEETPIKGSHSAMARTGGKHPTKGVEYECPVCEERMYWAEARRHDHRSEKDADTTDECLICDGPVTEYGACQNTLQALRSEERDPD